MRLPAFSIPAISGTLALFGAITASSVTLAAPFYDGNWSVRVLAEADACSLDQALPIRVADGQVSVRGFLGPRARGQVQQTGEIDIQLSHAGDIVEATGALDGTTGGGSWSSSTLNCGGTWMATKN